MTLPVGANPLPPPPQIFDRALNAWLRQLYEKIGKATDAIPVKSTNITGVLASANAAPNVAKNTSNDATADSVDAGSNATVRVYGPGGVGSNWSRFRNGASVASHAAVTFTGKAYSTRFYVAFDTALNTWIISTSYKDTTGDNMIQFSVLTVASGGGGGSSGGGGTGSGGEGGVDSGGLPGRGFLW